MSSLTETLAQAGLESISAEIYLILVQNGEMAVPQVLEKTDLSRASVYEALSELLALGYVEYRKDGRNAFYKPVHPNKLFGLIEEKKRELSLFEREMKNTIKSLIGEYNLANNKPGVRFFEGEEGIREVIFDSLNAKNEILTYLDVDATQNYISNINKEYVKQRIEKNIYKRQIAPDTPFTRERYKKYSPLLEVRLMPKDMKPFNTSVQIYNNTISFSTLNEKKMIGVIIEDKQIVDLHRSIFEYVWKQLSPLSTPQTHQD